MLVERSPLWEWIKWSIEVTDNHMLEIQNSVCALIVGVIMLLGGDRLYERSPAAWQMFELAPAVVWALLYISAGVGHLICLKLNKPKIKQWVLLIKAALWVFIGTATIMGIGPFAPAVWIYYIFSLVAFRGYFKIQVGVT